MTERLRILVYGYIVRGPLGGLVWHHLQYVIGLLRLGHDVYFLEDGDDYPSCYDPSKGITSFDPSFGLSFIALVFEQLGMTERWAYFDTHTTTWFGPAAGGVADLLGSADVLLNVSGVNPLRDGCAAVPVRVLIDTDPVFTQIRHLQDPDARKRAVDHTHFLSFGESVGTPGCLIPDDGLPWRPTRQPVVMDLWPRTPPCAEAPFTTVMQWDSYASREYCGRSYGMKSASFEPYLDLPTRCGASLELALGSRSAPRKILGAHGWRLRDPLEVTTTPWTYRAYLQGSKAEFSVAKQGYVLAKSGWFSERSACYLASGRPVLVQDTGFSAWLPTGSGLLVFRTPGEALAGIDQIEDRLAEHCRAARDLAETYFAASTVLGEMLMQVTP